MFKAEAQIRLQLPNMDSSNQRLVFDPQSGAPEGRMNEGYQAIPDSGLANEYMRLQDDFMKWQHQLLQNQQILHNRVAPIAANPPTLNSVGIVSNMVNEMPSNAPAQPRRPIEITIPIRLEDSDDVVDNRETQLQPSQQAKEMIQSPKVVQTNHIPAGPTPWRKGPSVPIGAWQERPAPPKTQPEVPERTHSQMSDMARPFGKAPVMQTVLQATPQCRQQPSSQPSYQQVIQPNSQQRPQPQGFQQMPGPAFQQVPQSGFQQQMPQSNFQQPNSQPSTRNNIQPSPYYDPRSETSQNGTMAAPTGERGDEGINARFSSVVTLNNDKGDPNSAPPKDKVRSVVQFNNAAEVAPQGCPGAPFHSRIISAATREPEAEEAEPRSPPFNPPSGGFSGTPMSSRLVQQAVQQPLGRSQVSPPKIERLPSPPKMERQISPPKMERQPSPPQATSPEHEPSPPPFAGVKLRPVETRVSPPKNVVPQPPSPPSEFGAPPPPPPPPPASKVPHAPPPPPPAPGMPEERRTSTGKKIISSTNAPQLDAREELMMAIRQFGGSNKLKRATHPPPGMQW